ncbi:uncharacterized protein PHACADRAFT_202497 [Phanerochaete carnosa HHB-10118-sp]|uniref:Uncharacterized protein n=1 Tax=Phanerochaete carnosa (strain HHB-10118-sp) TaxID=650164 RepID=K5UGU8_PHACS|nr:uncharacterized protein PHACADRAFT_202497 [Phanerochaete carnosa HHB-10118-sp]EKM48706.1 hypothetical protein PHACADRAFT_202497 [Phanerochaete carnosa HHB-10118-sp]
MHFILNLKSVHYVEELWISTDLGTDDTSLKKVDTIRALPCADKPLDLFAFIDVDHRVLTKKEITIDSCLNFETSRPRSRLPSFDMLGLLREVFMKRCILEQLNNVNGNAMTMTVTKNVDGVNNIWEVDPMTWYLYLTWRAIQCRCDQECRQYMTGSHRFEGWQSCGGPVKAKLRQVEHSAELSYRSLKCSVMIRLIEEKAVDIKAKGQGQ